MYTPRTSLSGVSTLDNLCTIICNSVSKKKKIGSLTMFLNFSWLTKRTMSFHLSRLITVFAKNTVYGLLKFVTDVGKFEKLKNVPDFSGNNGKTLSDVNKIYVIIRNLLELRPSQDQTLLCLLPERKARTSPN